MGYYSLSHSIETEQIGKEYPQIQSIGGTIKADASNSIYNVYNEMPDFTPNLNYLEVHNNAKLTDVVSASITSKGFIVNDKVKIILESFNLPLHKFFPATLAHKGVLNDNFYWFFYSGDLSDFIDYSNTDFLLVDSFGERKEISINSKKDLKTIYNNTSTLNKIRSTGIKYKDSIKLDLFESHLADSRTFISDKLKRILEENKVTGIQITPVTFI